MTLAQRLEKLSQLEAQEIAIINRLKNLSSRQKEIERQRTKNNYDLLRESVIRTYG